MKLSVLTMVTKPNERQDMWREALFNYCEFADEVVVVYGNASDAKSLLEAKSFLGKKLILQYLYWPEKWDYIELPRHLNYGRKFCTGDWILKMDIDYFIHEDNYKQLNASLDVAEKDCVAINKLNINFGHFYSKAHQSICFRNKPQYQFGRIITRDSDLCYPVNVDGHEELQGYHLPYGKELEAEKIWTELWNYNYTFKTQEVAKAHFWRFVRAYRKCNNDSKFGEDVDSSFVYFIQMMKEEYKKSKPNLMEPRMHPRPIREAYLNLTPQQCGYNLWGKL